MLLHWGEAFFLSLCIQDPISGLWDALKTESKISVLWYLFLGILELEVPCLWTWNLALLVAMGKNNRLSYSAWIVWGTESGAGHGNPVLWHMEILQESGVIISVGVATALSKARSVLQEQSVTVGHFSPKKTPFAHVRRDHRIAELHTPACIWGVWANGPLIPAPVNKTFQAYT